MTPQQIGLGAGAVAIAVAVIVAVMVGSRDDEPAEPDHTEAVAVAEDYLRALADADVEGLCDTYSAPSRQAAFERYEVKTCADYARAYVADDRSGYAVTRHMESEFEAGRATGDDQRVRVAFTGTLKYLGKNQAAIDYYQQNPTVDGSVVVVREGEGWKVDAAATEETF